jgi:hypothetical protein
MRDFDKFFYLVTICFYRDDYDDSVLADQHGEGGFGIYRFTYDPVEASRHTPITFSIDQVNWRFIDKTENGFIGDGSAEDSLAYKPANMWLAVTQLITTTNPDGSKTITQRYIGGATSGGYVCSLNKVFKNGLPEGDYVVLYKADWQPEHKLRKLVLSIYDENPIKMKLVSKSYNKDYVDEMIACVEASKDTLELVQ